MKRRWQRILCRLGRHEWMSVQFSFAGWGECMRCGKRTDVRP